MDDTIVVLVFRMNAVHHSVGNLLCLFNGRASGDLDVQSRYYYFC